RGKPDNPALAAEHAIALEIAGSPFHPATGLPRILSPYGQTFLYPSDGYEVSGWAYCDHNSDKVKNMEFRMAKTSWPQTAAPLLVDGARPFEIYAQRYDPERFSWSPAPGAYGYEITKGKSDSGHDAVLKGKIENGAPSGLWCAMADENGVISMPFCQPGGGLLNMKLPGGGAAIMDFDGGKSPAAVMSDAGCITRMGDFIKGCSPSYCGSFDMFSNDCQSCQKAGAVLNR
ncbi:MAG: hypothetical protein FWF01_03590, partial [Alphaproteobacteria bacterium]|nr:hypothetical protein [Alphaproteobacteria bacterium]